MAVVHMGGDGHDARVFATIDVVRWHGDVLWWLNLSHCSACGQDWMIAPEERIYDDHYLKRLTPDEADAIMARNAWPGDFLRYEAVLRFGQRNSKASSFLDPRSGLMPTIEDLRRERHDISDAEIGELIGISEKQVARLARPTWLERIVRKLAAPRL